MNNTFFTSDSHFSHSAIIGYCNRPFTKEGQFDEEGKPVPDVTLHDETLIFNWNKVVQPQDTVYHLGDFGFGRVENLLRIFKRLNGHKHLVIGNHDREAVKLPWVSQSNLKELKIDGTYYQLCHYPMRSWNKSFHGAKSLFGHSHGTLSPHMWSCDVGTDCWGFTPVSLKQLEELFKKLPRDGQGKMMPRGTIWNAERHMKYGFEDFFVGDGSMDNVDPEELCNEEIGDDELTTLSKLAILARCLEKNKDT